MSRDFRECVGLVRPSFYDENKIKWGIFGICLGIFDKFVMQTVHFTTKVANVVLWAFFAEVHILLRDEFISPKQKKNV